MIPPDIIRAVAATLRYVAQDAPFWELAGWADDVERGLTHPDSACCPMCAEVTCDDDCPMRPHRHPQEETA